MVRTKKLQMGYQVKWRMTKYLMRTIEIALSTSKLGTTLHPKLCRRITTSTQLSFLSVPSTLIMTSGGLQLVKVILRAIRTVTTKLQISFIPLNVVVSSFLLSAWLKLHAGERSWHMSFEIHTYTHTTHSQNSVLYILVNYDYI